MNTYICDISSKKSRVKSVNGANAAFIILTTAFCVYLLLHPHISPASVRESLTFCATTLIPSLFPMMVAGEILILSGFGDICAKSVGRAFSRIFGVHGEGAAAFALGCVCGYPVGGKTALSLYGDGKLDRDECEFLCALSNNAGPGFVVAGIGAAIWGNTGFGAALYLTELISAFIAGILLRPLFIKPTVLPHKAGSTEQRKVKARKFSEIFSVSVASGVTSILKVCGFVVIFEILLTGFFSMLPDFPGKQLFTVVASSIAEITSGAASSGNYALSGTNTAVIFGKLMTFALVGWGGLSAHMQLNAFASEKGMVLKKYYVFKALVAALCVLIGAAYIALSS